jgi:hypothetical protein
LRAETGPFHETERDLAARAGLDGVKHLRIRNGGRIAVALEQEFGTIDATRHIWSEHQQQIDRNAIHAGSQGCCVTSGGQKR